jgi:hydroxyethylthiazole kinase-like uncharacterized protein yjeF
MEIKYVSAEQMAKIDQVAIANGLPLDEMMEKAGKAIADFVANLKPKKILVLYGKGNNGGGVLVAAKYLLDRGFEVRIKGIGGVSEVVEEKLSDIRKFKVKRGVISWLGEEGDLIIDGLLGIGLKGAPRGDFVDMISRANKSRNKGIKIVSNDLPSGLGPDNGRFGDLTIQADHILTLALPKMGLKSSVRKGRVHLVDIGISKEIYTKAGMKGVNPEEIFKGKKIIKLV